MKNIIAISLVLSFLLLRPATSNAAIDPKQQISIILFSGLGGAILGLSTLSFYEQPQDHLRNIAVGGAIALIGSVVFTTVYAAKQSKAETEDAKEEGTEGTNKATKEDKDKGKDKDKKKKKEKTIKNKGENTEQKDEDSYDNSDDGAMLDDIYKNNDIKVKIFMADCTNSKFKFDPYFFYVNTTPTNRYGERAVNFYSRIIEVNF